MVWNERFITVEDGTKLFCREAGEGTPLLLIHGASGAGTPLWACTGRLAERQGCAVYGVPGGHNGVRERPDEFGDAPCGFFAGEGT